MSNLNSNINLFCFNQFPASNIFRAKLHFVFFLLGLSTAAIWNKFEKEWIRSLQKYSLRKTGLKTSLKVLFEYYPTKIVTHGNGEEFFDALFDGEAIECPQKNKPRKQNSQTSSRGYKLSATSLTGENFHTILVSFPVWVVGRGFMGSPNVHIFMFK